MLNRPPPIIDSARVLEYARTDGDVSYTGRINLFSDGTRVERVPCLAICRNYFDPSDILLLFCNEEWVSVGGIGFTTVGEAKAKAELGYQGIDDMWTDPGFSDDEIDDFLREEYEVDPKSEWWKMICSFCGKDQHDFENLISSSRAAICNRCIVKFHVELGAGDV